MSLLRTARMISVVGLACLACEGQTEEGTSADSGSGGAAGSNALAGGGISSAGTSSTAGGSGAVTVVTYCETPSDCLLRSASCCGTCGAPSATDLIAITVDSASDYAAQACGTTLVGCPACAAMPNPDLFATCDDGTCTAVNLAESSLTTCQEASDCVLRAAQCCECGASMALTDLVALDSTATADYASMVCDEGAACAECAPVYPTDAVIECVSGHCQLTR